MFKGEASEISPNKDAGQSTEYRNSAAEFSTTTRRKWRQKQTEGAMVLPRKTIPGQPQRRFADGLHRPVGLVFASGHLLWTACQLSGERQLEPRLAGKCCKNSHDEVNNFVKSRRAQ